MINLWLIFLTGLTVGGLTCLAVQGGLLASVIASREGQVKKDQERHALFATAIFLVFKFTAYTLLGLFLGGFGGVININGQVQTLMQLAAGIYMVAVALNLLNVHPIFRYVIIQPPRFLTKLVKNQSKSKDIFAPAFLGAMTIFIPCGTTLAMETLAISSANAFIGAAVMAAFILGTIPLFFGIGFVTSLLGEAFKTKFLKLAAVVVIYLGITSINGALVALGSPLTLQSLAQNFSTILNNQSSVPASGSDVATNQEPEINITASGYSPNYFKVKKDLPVTIRLTNTGTYSCASAFRIPSLGISENVGPNQSQTFTFTPRETGQIQFSCVMGMYRGVIEVI